MRIISKYHDYYDCVQSTGQDRTLVYHRKSDELKLDKVPSWISLSNNDNHQQHIIGFCGRIIPVVKHSTNDRPFSYSYSLKQLDDYATRNWDETEIAYYFSGKHAEYNRMIRSIGRARRFDCQLNQYNQTQQKYKEFFDQAKGIADSTRMKLFETYNCPIFLLRNNWKDETYLITNPVLKDFEYFRELDPFQTYQEIAMYLGSVAQPRKPIPKISDDTMAEIKGFDKFSFRKPATKIRK